MALAWQPLTAIQLRYGLKGLQSTVENPFGSPVECCALRSPAWRCNKYPFGKGEKKNRSSLWIDYTYGINTATWLLLVLHRTWVSVQKPLPKIHTVSFISAGNTKVPQVWRILGWFCGSGPFRGLADNNAQFWCTLRQDSVWVQF